MHDSTSAGSFALHAQAPKNLNIQFTVANKCIIIIIINLFATNQNI